MIEQSAPGRLAGSDAVLEHLQRRRRGEAGPRRRSIRAPCRRSLRRFVTLRARRLRRAPRRCTVGRLACTNERPAPGLRALLAPATTRRGFLRLAGTTAAFSALAQLRVLPASALACAAGAPSERFFDDAETEILTQLMQRMTETGLPDAPRVRDTRAVATVDAVCRGLDPAVSGVLPLALRLFEWGPLLFDLRFARFSELVRRRAGRLAARAG